MASTPLTVPFALRLGDLLNWVTQGRKVRYAVGDAGGAVVILTGTLRHVVRDKDDFCFLDKGQDVRDAFVRITLTNGLDVALPITRVVSLMEDGGFALDD